MRHQTRWASSEKSTKGIGAREGTFKGQMLESITQRIAREKEELRKAAIEREANAGGRNVAQTLGEKLSSSSREARAQMRRLFADDSCLTPFF